MSRLKISLMLALAIAAAGGIALALRSTPRRDSEAMRAPPGPAPALEARFVGRQACAACHLAAEDQWRGSHHDLAMQEATPATVRGDFNDASFTYHDVTTTFFRNGEDFRVRTDGPNGALHEYRVAYTFGVDPLQQYLLEFLPPPSGRYQALNVCWDTRAADQGGQRWFHLYPDENVNHEDILHWTGPYQNWNHMCAECHSTGVHKNYDAAGDRYQTSWSEIDVSCEACHGPGSGHVAWAQQKQAGNAGADPNMGLLARLRETDPGFWVPDPQTGIAKRSHPRTSFAEIETCARCHSRRGTITEDFTPGQPLGNTHRLALLTTLYEIDGQIKDEDFEHGSFLQSKMYAAGVTCTDCHHAHSLKVAPGNQACIRCHTSERYDAPAHHFHKPDGPGLACVDCHMPTRNYMVVHARHDHSLRVPRPDLTVSIGTPNACNGCHKDQTPQWAAEEIARRTPGKALRPHFGEILAAAQRGQPGSQALLASLVGDTTQPAIVRATAVEMLNGAEQPPQLLAALADADPLVRGAAVNAVSTAEPSELVRWLAGLLSDPVRQVRIDAARRLAAVPDALLTADQRAARGRAMEEYLEVQQHDADRAEAHLNLGALHAERSEADAAEREYLAALRLSPRFPATYVNLGDLYRQVGREDDAVRVLREGLAMAPGNADVPHALGLALVRRGELQEAIPLLERAAILAPDVIRYAYVYGVALESAGPPGRGIEVLRHAHERRPDDGDVLAALVSYCRAAGRLNEAVVYADRLAALRPGDAALLQMREQIKAERARAATAGPAPPSTSSDKNPNR